MKRVIAAAAVATFALASGAHAQLASPVHFGISGGATFPISNAAEDPNGGTVGNPTFKSDMGYNVNAHLGFSVPMFPLGLRVDGSWNQLAGKSQNFNDGFESIDAKVDRRIISGTVNAIVMPAGLLVARPYLIGGVGAYNVRSSVKASLAGGSFDQSKTSTGLNGGAGIRFGLSGFNAFLEARYHYVFNEQKNDTACNNSNSCIPHKATTFVPISFGLMF